MGGACTESEIPLLLTLSHLFGEVEAVPQAPPSSVKPGSSRRSSPKTLSGGEFGWGGTSVKK